MIARAAGPDERGYFSLGTNADYTSAFIGEVPFFLEVTRDSTIHPRPEPDSRQPIGWLDPHGRGAPADQPPQAFCQRIEAIAGHIAELIPDGACLQVGRRLHPRCLAGNAA